MNSECICDDLEKQKNTAYWERNQLVAALSKIYPAHLAKHPKDQAWEDDWRTIVVIYMPADGLDNRQCTWHIHDHDVPLFDHLEYNDTYFWDGHSTEEKYRRLRQIKPREFNKPL